MGPRTRAAISPYESTHGLVVDGMITPQFLDQMGVA
jgi:peptidoglycan hydrolase-like protein with peptidoglycan-binding domain